MNAIVHHYNSGNVTINASQTTATRATMKFSSYSVQVKATYKILVTPASMVNTSMAQQLDKMTVIYQCKVTSTKKHVRHMRIMVALTPLHISLDTKKTSTMKKNFPNFIEVAPHSHWSRLVMINGPSVTILKLPDLNITNANGLARATIVTTTIII